MNPGFSGARNPAVLHAMGYHGVLLKAYNSGEAPMKLYDGEFLNELVEMENERNPPGLDLATSSRCLVPRRHRRASPSSEEALRNSGPGIYSESTGLLPEQLLEAEFFKHTMQRKRLNEVLSAREEMPDMPNDRPVNDVRIHGAAATLA